MPSNFYPKSATVRTTAFYPKSNIEITDAELAYSDNEKSDKPLLSSSGSIRGQTQRSSLCDKAYLCCKALLALSALVLVAYAAVTLGLLQRKLTHALDQNVLLLSRKPQNFTVVSDCGSSLVEARAKGCFFDAMTWDWYPKECADPELSAKVINDRDWQYYTEPEGHEEDLVDIRDVVAGKYEHLYVHNEYHVRHCAYLFLKMSSAIQKGLLLDDDLANPDHINHCHMLLANPIDRKAMQTEVRMAYTRCVKVE